MRDAHEEWTALLDLFEADLRAGGSPQEHWAPAATPMPERLAQRARDLLARQRHEIARMEREQAQIREHMSALKRVPPSRGDAAVYVDVSA